MSPYYHLIKNSIPTNPTAAWWQSLSGWADLVTIVGLGGLLFTGLTYLKNKKDAKIQTIQAVKYELINTLWYIKLMEDEHFNSGYPADKIRQWESTYALSWASPLTIPNPINMTFAKNYSLLPGMGFMTNEINHLMAGYIQWCLAYNNFLEHIRAFIFSRSAEKNMALAKKYTITQDNHLELNSALTQDEQEFTAVLMSMYENLFFEIVGDEAKGHLYAHHDSLQKALDKYEKSVGLFF